MVLFFSKLGGGDDESDEKNDTDDGLMGGADAGLMGGGMMDEGDDEGTETELTYQLDEIEKEIDTLENRVEVVRGENEKISDKISTVDRNVDKLVDLYEIVTEGVNPFAADQEIGNAFDAADGGIVGSEDEIGDDIDDEIASAEADEFLDEDIDEDDEDGFGDEFDAMGTDDDELDSRGDGEDEFGETFDETDEEDEFEELPDDGLEDESHEGDEVSEIPGADSSADSETDDVLGSNPVIDGENGEAGEPPYLVTQPSRNDAELVTLEWLDFLVDTAGIVGAAQTIAYYESIDWISEPVATYLRSMLNGYGDGATPATELAKEPEPRSVLSTDEHKRSLQYIAWIATPDKAPELLTTAPPLEEGAPPAS